MCEVAVAAEEAVRGGMAEGMLKCSPVSGGEDRERRRSSWRIGRLRFSSRGNGNEGLVSCVGGEEIPDAVRKEKR